MLVFGVDIPLVEVIFTLAIIIFIILVEIIIIIILSMKNLRMTRHLTHSSVSVRKRKR